MKKNMLLCTLVLVLILLLAGCGCEHEWFAASCAAPKTCSLCGETEGESLPHTWVDATCTAPKTCSVCSATEGEPLPHTWTDATCTVAKTCSVCQTTEGEPLPHTWVDATCTVAKTCSVCRTTEGEPLPHTWADATCTAPKTCTVCQLTEGEKAAHNWKAATCTAPKTCSVCKQTEGKTAAHKWQEATTEAPQTCSVCKVTSGNKLNTDPRFTTKSTKALQGNWVCDVTLTDEMLGLVNFGGADCQLTMKFGNTGALSMGIKVKDEKTFMQKYNAYTVNLMYAEFAAQGYSKAQADQAMLEAYGLNVPDYVTAALKGYKAADILAAFTSEEVYYVEGNKVFTALSWNAKFESNTYTLSGNKLVIDGVSLPDGGPSLTWTKA
ncbi:MAG: hypothetical protein IKA47_05900 [Oscillospiraceae bacterium]|nr:hypothetical protein [Oscillospiraceae bacterium]